VLDKQEVPKPFKKFAFFRPENFQKKMNISLTI